MLVKLNGKDSEPVVKALIKSASKLPQELYKSLTWDRGTEMHAHKQFTVATCRIPDDHMVACETDAGVSDTTLSSPASAYCS